MSQMYTQGPADASEHDGPGFADRVRNLHGWSVLLGAAAGLIFGLIIGWVVWPVQWTSAWPSDLSEEARAQYLAAVAQVYAYYPDERAAETARGRLYGLNDNLEEEIAAAQAFFDENPQRDSNVYITVLNELAAGLGVAGSAPALTDAGATSADAQAAPADGRSWGRWLLWLVLAIALIGGGLYVIGWLASRRRRGDEEADEGHAPSYGAPVTPGQPRPAGQSSGGSRGGFDMPAPDDYKFDQEPDDSIVYTSGTSVVEGEEYEDDTFFDDSSAAGFSQSGSTGSAAVEPPSSGTYPGRAGGPSASYGYQDAGAVVQEPAQAKPDQVIGTYIVHYQAGVPEFEESNNIYDPGTSRYIGECGMGVNMKNGILQDVPENVIAFDVWLFDQRRDRSLGNQTRVLLSEYAIDHDLEQAFIREQPDGPSPVVAQPGVSFQLKGENLSLDCEVLEVDYTTSGQDSGIFQNLKVEMKVSTRS